MKKIISLLTLNLLLFSAFSQSVKTIKISDVKELIATNAVTLEIKQSDEETVVVEGRAEDLEYIKVKQSGNKLSISIEQKGGKNIQLEKLVVTVNVSQLPTRIVGERAVSIKIEDEFVAGDVKFELKEASSLSLQGTYDNLNINAENASQVEGAINGANTLTILAQQASKVNIEGICEVLKVFAMEASTVSLPDFMIQKALITATSASSVDIDMVENLKVVKLTEVSSVKYNEAKSVKEENVDASSSVVKG